MGITFNSGKNERNIAERGLSFELVAELEWESALLAEVGAGDAHLKTNVKLIKPCASILMCLMPYRQQGKGWQTHINEVLRQNMPRQK